MSYYILGNAKERFREKTIRETAGCIAVCVAVIAVNLLLCLVRTEATHLAFLLINIVTDSAVFGLLFFFAGTRLLPRRKLYALALREPKGVVMAGRIGKQLGPPKIVGGLECVVVPVEEMASRKVFVAVESGVPFDLEGDVVLTLVDNIVVRARCGDE